MKKILKVLSESYIFVMLAALIIGLLVPAAKYLTAWNTFLLQIIFFLSCLKIDLKQMKGAAKDWKFLLLGNLLMLVIFPALTWLIINPLYPDMGLALFLLAAMPVGMTAPLLVEVAGGKQTIAMVLTVTTSLLAPITIPLLTKLFYGTTVAVDALGMFKQLCLVIFVPFVLALIVRRLLPMAVQKIKPASKPVSIILLGLLIAGAVAAQASAIISLSRNWWQLFVAIGALFVFFIATHLIGYYAFWWKKHDEKNTASISLVYMNFTLAIFLASQFFPKPEVLLPLVLSILPWATLLPLWKQVSEVFLKTRN
ncbi:MAG: bile acid:sodium symporter [Patescibacteria group bacterium]|nr:bile acid:sodium symporter [Patescibacteria group bacterium]